MNLVPLYIAAWVVALAYASFWYWRRRDVIGTSACMLLALIAVVLLVLR